MWPLYLSLKFKFQELAALLYRVEDDRIELDSSKVEEILGVSKKEATSSSETSKRNSSGKKYRIV